MFESDRLPEGWEVRLNGMDAVWVPTEFQRRIFEAGGVDKHRLRVVGESVDTAYFRRGAVQESDIASLDLPAVSRGTTRFCAVFKWEWRKGYDVLLRALDEAFRSRPHDAELVILASAFHGSDRFDAQVAAFCAARGLACATPIRVLSGLPSHRLRALYSTCRAVVQPSRGEGWGRPHMEAMAMGVPVVATNWSGPTEFVTPANGYLLAYTHLEANPDGPFAGHAFAEPDVDHLVSLLRRIHGRPDEAARKGERAARDVRRRFSPEVINARVVELLQDVARPRTRRRV